MIFIPTVASLIFFCILCLASWQLQHWLWLQPLRERILSNWTDSVWPSLISCRYWTLLVLVHRALHSNASLMLFCILSLDLWQLQHTTAKGSCFPTVPTAGGVLVWRRIREWRRCRDSRAGCGVEQPRKVPDLSPDAGQPLVPAWRLCLPGRLWPLWAQVPPSCAPTPPSPALPLLPTPRRPCRHYARLSDLGKFNISGASDLSGV